MMSDDDQDDINTFLDEMGFSVEGDEREPLWRREWQGMPEFVQERVDSYAKVIVRFRNQEDVDRFSALMEQTVTADTKSLWFPKLAPKEERSVGMNSNKRYVDEP